MKALPGTPIPAIMRIIGMRITAMVTRNSLLSFRRIFSTLVKTFFFFLAMNIPHFELTVKFM